MKKAYHITIVFFFIFIAGIVSFTTYIDCALEKKEHNREEQTATGSPLHISFYS
ncbi:hypothetical protein [Sinomicrobium soli]|uniref:hypothetical protein n=1 Tax=Sinomicrobium sp. N-1-3-6 TaxID=2219864 RepID=UPI001374C793|nr:hypothetical protein [Sinomicrobium sp. N-1-3-6]